MSLVKKGCVLWFTGLSGAGKSTLSSRVAERLRAAGCAVELLDGDEVRTHLCKGLGFSKEDRDTNVRRIGFVARLLARNGVIAITAAISPYRAIRDEQRELAERDGAGFCEVFMECPVEVLAERDVKGLYKKALAGEIDNFTGVSDPYEPPQHPDVAVRSDREPIEAGLDRVIACLVEREYLAPELLAALGGANPDAAGAD
ncbi:adenylyl-sulfate kinase [Haliangium sp.]|uniref:adenylyl-sulfate kinase n=1 Tax=Haliangium sp. TaxID=2663208 RepID=UPI003D09E144